MASFSKFSIATKLYTIFALLAVATVACALMAIFGTRYQQQLAEDVGKAYRGSEYVEKINGLIYAVVMESRGIYMSAEIPTARPFAKNLLVFNDRIEKVIEEWRSHL